MCSHLFYKTFVFTYQKVSNTGKDAPELTQEWWIGTLALSNLHLAMNRRKSLLFPFLGLSAAFNTMESFYVLDILRVWCGIVDSVLQWHWINHNNRMQLGYNIQLLSTSSRSSTSLYLFWTPGPKPLYLFWTPYSVRMYTAPVRQIIPKHSFG